MAWLPRNLQDSALWAVTLQVKREYTVLRHLGQVRHFAEQCTWREGPLVHNAGECWPFLDAFQGINYQEVTMETILNL